MSFTGDQIFQKVRGVLVKSLDCLEDEVRPGARLQADLGAESIDFLDIVFQLERAFGIKIPRGELFPEAIFQGDPEAVQNGQLTASGLQELEEHMPFADLTKFRKNPDISALSDLFTVGLITKYVCWKLHVPAPM